MTDHDWRERLRLIELALWLRLMDLTMWLGWYRAWTWCLRRASAATWRGHVEETSDDGPF